MKFAAIDIGTNAVRLLLSKVIEDGAKPIFEKESFIRFPLRLGDDTFRNGRITDDKTERLIEIMVGYRNLIHAYSAEGFGAYATSALREAENGADVVRMVRDRSGIDILVIDGKMEAEVLYANHIEELFGPTRNYVYMDVGGGSTELSLISQTKVIASKSLNIGSVRMLHDRVQPSEWKTMKAWLKENTSNLKPLFGIGTGGNISKIFRLARIKEGKPISYGVLQRFQRYLSSFTLEERITQLGLKPDRADVIVLASDVYLSVMKWAKIKKMFVPQIGLADGIIHVLYERFKRNGNGSPQE